MSAASRRKEKKRKKSHVDRCHTHQQAYTGTQSVASACIFIPCVCLFVFSLEWRFSFFFLFSVAVEKEKREGGWAGWPSGRHNFIAIRLALRSRSQRSIQGKQAPHAPPAATSIGQSQGMHRRTEPRRGRRPNRAQQSQRLLRTAGGRRRRRVESHWTRAGEGQIHVAISRWRHRSETRDCNATRDRCDRCASAGCALLAHTPLTARRRLWTVLCAACRLPPDF